MASQATRLGWLVGLLTISATFGPVLVGFLFGIDTGFSVVERIYPQPQRKQPFFDSPAAIYSHMYAMGVALFIGIFQLLPAARRVSILLHRYLGYTYVAALTIGA